VRRRGRASSSPPRRAAREPARRSGWKERRERETSEERRGYARRKDEDGAAKRRRARVVGSTCVLAATNYPTTTQHGSTTKPYRSGPSSLLTPSRDAAPGRGPFRPCRLLRDLLSGPLEIRGSKNEIFGADERERFWKMKWEISTKV